MVLKISKNKIGYWCCALSGILSMNPFFVWNSFLGGSLKYLTYSSYLLSILYLMSMRKEITRIKIKNLVGGILFGILFLFTYFHSMSPVGFKTIFGALLAYLNMFIFATSSIDIKKEVFERFTMLFIASLIPGLIYYFLELIGVSLSIGAINSQNQLLYTNSAESSGVVGYYKLYIGAVMRINSNIRFSGIYDEAGLVGTVSALLLVARKFNLKEDHKCKWLVLLNFISFSFAGYVIIIIYFFLKWLKKGKWKLIIGSIVGIFIFYILMNIQTDNALLLSIKDRFEITNKGISLINNRETSTFEIGYSTFKNSSIGRKLFGFGYGASSQDKYLLGSSSYKLTIFDYGYIGFAFRIYILLYFYSKRAILNCLKYWDKFVLFLIFIISIYQRPAVFYAYYFIILFGGYAYIDFLSGNKSKNREE